MLTGCSRDLVALDPVLLDLVKLALELSLALQTFLRSAHVDDFPVDLLPIHFINCLEEQRGRLLLSLSTFGFFFNKTVNVMVQYENSRFLLFLL